MVACNRAHKGLTAVERIGCAGYDDQEWLEDEEVAEWLKAHPDELAGIVEDVERLSAKVRARAYYLLVHSSAYRVGICPRAEPIVKAEIRSRQNADRQAPRSRAAVMREAFGNSGALTILEQPTLTGADLHRKIRTSVVNDLRMSQKRGRTRPMSFSDYLRAKHANDGMEYTPEPDWTNADRFVRGLGRDSAYVDEYEQFESRDAARRILEDLRRVIPKAQFQAAVRSANGEKLDATDRKRLQYARKCADRWRKAARLGT